MKIPFYKPYYSGKEMEYMKEAMNKGEIEGDGAYTKRVKAFIENEFSVREALLTTSATHALELATLLIDIKPGDEVIMPSYTFPSTANAVVLRGGKPVFADIEEPTLNIDCEDILSQINSNTKAIMPVHYGGIGCNMDKIMEIAKLNNLYVIEDAAQGVNAKYKNKYLGTWGHMGCFSFHKTKNYTSGEGGALLLNIEDPSIIEKAENIRQKGTNRTKFLRGEINKYSWVDMGSSYLPSDLLMAFLYAQLEQMGNITLRRKYIHQYYSSKLKKYQDEGRIKMSMVPEESTSNYHLFYILFPSEKIRDDVMDKLKAKGIHTAIHFMPLHNSPMGQKLGCSKRPLPVTEKVAKSLLRLPMYPSMEEAELEYVAKNLVKIIEEIKG